MTGAIHDLGSVVGRRGFLRSLGRHGLLAALGLLVWRVAGRDDGDCRQGPQVLCRDCALLPGCRVVRDRGPVRPPSPSKSMG